jgi:hypothetical protein
MRIPPIVASSHEFTTIVDSFNLGKDSVNEGHINRTEDSAIEQKAICSETTISVEPYDLARIVDIRGKCANGTRDIDRREYSLGIEKSVRVQRTIVIDADDLPLVVDAVRPRIGDTDEGDIQGRKDASGIQKPMNASTIAVVPDDLASIINLLPDTFPKPF